jgi:hypothetical protein
MTIIMQIAIINVDRNLFFRRKKKGRLAGSPFLSV